MTANHDTPANKLLTRRQAAERLGVSVTSVRRMEGQQLHPQQDDRGHWLFAAAEVAKLASALKPRRKRDGSRGARPQTTAQDGVLAAQVFKAFHLGYDLRDIVMEYKVPPAVVRELFTEWSLSLKGGEQKRRAEQVRADEQRSERDWAKFMKARDR